MEVALVLDALRPWFAPLLAAATGVILAWIGFAVVYRVVRSASRRTRLEMDDAVVNYCASPLRVLAWLGGLSLARGVVAWPEGEVAAIADHALQLAWIASAGWLALDASRAVQAVALRRFDIAHTDNLRARSVQTQVRVFQRITAGIILVLTVGAMLMTFESFESLGTSILASAGVAGIVIGFAAQKTLGNLLAGIQIAVTQPIRIDDVVIVEGEWGRIEEITLTYVVVRIWDLRRLVLPITYFTENTFQNWTRTSSRILGTVSLYADYRVPVDAVRERLKRICREEGEGLWDGEVCVLQVTDATERAMVLRALMGSPDASSAWELRCKVRERLIDFLQREYPESLPRQRFEGEMRGSDSGREGADAGDDARDEGSAVGDDPDGQDGKTPGARQG